MSRFSLLDRPLVLPMKCAVCGSSARKDSGFADMGVSIERFGRLYLCSGCVLEVAELMGMAPVAKLAVAEKKCQVAVKRLAEVIDENRNLKDAMDTLRNLDRYGSSIRSGDSVRPVAELSAAVEGEGQDDPESSEQTSSRESGSVSTTTELFQFS